MWSVSLLLRTQDHLNVLMTQIISNIEISKEGVNTYPLIRNLNKNEHFVTFLGGSDKKACVSFRLVLLNFLGGNKSSKTRKLAENMLKTYQTTGRNVLKNWFPPFPFRLFLTNHGDVNDENGERFHHLRNITESKLESINAGQFLSVSYNIHYTVRV